MTERDDEELHQPRRRVGTAVLTSLVGVAVVAGVLVVALDRDAPVPPAPTTSTAAPTPDPQPSTLVPFAAPRGMLLAVRGAYPRARLVEVGVAVPVRADSDRNYQFQAGSRRITVVVGPADTRPAVQTTSRRDVLVVAKRSGRRIAVSVRTFGSTVRRSDLRAARHLVADARLLAAS